MRESNASGLSIKRQSCLFFQRFEQFGQALVALVDATLGAGLHHGIAIGHRLKNRLREDARAVAARPNNSMIGIAQ